MYTHIQWDEGKNRSNLRKHGIGWIGPMIGVVVFTLGENEGRDAKIMRILSARKASKKEVALFEQEIKS